MKFPQSRQLDAMDCGPTCLLNISKYYGKTFNLHDLRRRCYISRRGVSLLGISDGAESLGFRTQGVRITWDQLKQEAQLPCVVHWNQNHFVVVYAILRTKRLLRKRNHTNKYIVEVSDPAHGLIKYTEEEFLKSWAVKKNGQESSGVALLLEPSPLFYKENDIDTTPKLFGLLNYLRPHKKFFLLFLFAMLTGTLLSLIFPFLTQSIIDYGVSNNNLSFIVMILIAQLALVFGQTANDFMRSWLMLNITTRISISLISDFLIKLMKLPMPFFDTKMIGDVMQRLSDHNRIQTFLTESLVNIFFGLITMLIYGTIMAFYHLNILMVFAVGSSVYIVWVSIFLQRRRELNYKNFQQNSSNQSNMIQLISGMQEIKLNNCEKQKRWQWERIQAQIFKVNVKGLMLSQKQLAGATFINHTQNLLITFLSAKAVIEGEMTLGGMISIQYIVGQLNGPISQLVGFIQSAQDTKISLERLGEIHQMKDEESPEDNKSELVPAQMDITVNDLVFQYEDPDSKKVLNGLSFKIPANKITAIVGTSGSGKTTLMKLLLRFYQPKSGGIYLGAVPLNKYSEKSWRESCAAVMQEGFIFSDTISKNISLSEENPDQMKLSRAAEIANIKDLIDSLPLGYETKIGAEGHGLSSGQKQRVLIARAAYKDPEYLFLDEATNALDATNEKVIMDNLEEFFKNRTVLIIAHRLSTVMKADQIIVLENGQLLECGNYQELVERKDAFYSLVRDQLNLSGD